MKTYQLARGLVVRHGMRLWKFDHQVASDDPTFVFLDVLTGEPKTRRLAELVRDIEKGELDVVSSEDHARSSTRETRFTLLSSTRDLPERHQTELLRRYRYVVYMRKKGLTRGARLPIAAALKALNGRIPLQPEGSNEVDPNPPGASTVMAWMKKHQLSGGSAHALVSGYFRREPKKRIEERVRAICQKHLKRIYLTPARPSLVTTKVEIDTELKALADKGELEAKKATVSDSTLRRILSEYDPFVVAKLRFGAAYANNLYRYSLTGPRPRFVMQRYEVDHTILDIVVVCSESGVPLGRPTITVVIDAYSSYIVGFFVSFWGSGLASTLSALKVAIAPKDDYTQSLGLTNKWHSFGIPALFVVDNGLEFHARDFLAAAMLLNCDVDYCAVRRPWLKPFVERAMREINKFLPAEGRVHKPRDNYLPPSPLDTAAVTFDDLCRCLLKMFVDVYPTQVNELTLSMPLEQFQEGMSKVLPPMLPTSMGELDLIAAVSDIKSVSHDGVVLQFLRYRSEELGKLRRATGSSFKTSIKFNPEDLSTIYVQDPISKGWLIVPSVFPEYTRGLSIVQHRAIRSALKGRLNDRNAYELLVKEKHALIEMWRSAVHFGKKLPKRVVQAQQGLTSAQAFRALEKPTVGAPPPPDRLVESRSAPAVEEAFEEFESLQF